MNENETSIINYKDKFQALLNQPELIQLIKSEEYYFQKALDKYNEYINLQVSELTLHGLIHETGFNPFSYKKLLNNYEVSSIEYKTLKIVGELISYIDNKAAMKNELNQYDDKRTMALAFVRQNIWVRHLLEFKYNHSLDGVTEVVRNALNYLQNPLEELTVFKEDHRMAILDTFFNGNLEILFESMQSIGFKCNNPMNDGCLYSRAFYLDGIKEIWHTALPDYKCQVNYVHF